MRRQLFALAARAACAWTARRLFAAVSYETPVAQLRALGSDRRTRFTPLIAPSKPTPPARNRSLAAHHPLGTSTGFLDQFRGQWEELLSRALRISTFAAEFAALSEGEFSGLRRFLEAKARLPFIYLSVHAPVKHREVSEETLVEWLRSLPPTVETIVVHPDILESRDRYRRLGRRLVVENMDDRKPTGRTSDELADVFAELPDAGFCFDIAHAWSIDPTMRLAHDLLDRFGDRLRQVHLSSLAEGKHVPVIGEHEALFLPLLERCRDVPWILEAQMPDRWMGSTWIERVMGPSSSAPDR